jgi:hypothetical protein
MSVKKRTGRWAGRLAIASIAASIAMVAGSSSALVTSLSIEPVQGGPHPVRPAPPATTAPPTTVPKRKALPPKHIEKAPTIEHVSPPPTSPPTTQVRYVPPPPTTTTVPVVAHTSAPQPTIGNPSVSMPPDPDFLDVCPSSSLDLTGVCEDEALQAIDHGRASEGLGPMELPSDWPALSPAEQLFVATNLERTARGLTPFEGMAAALEAAAQAGANSGSDPIPPGGFPTDNWTSDAGEGFANPLETLYVWMYDDGTNSPNVDCSPGDPNGCWGHRDNLLAPFQCDPCVVGSADSPNGSWAELMTETTGDPELLFAWSSVN